MSRPPADRPAISAAGDVRSDTDFYTVVRVLVRRWYIVVLGALVTAAVALWIAMSIAPTYEAKGSAILVGAQSSNVPGNARDNPFTRLDSSTVVLTAVATQIMDDPRIRESLADGGASAGYEVGQASDGTPVFIVVATHADEQTALRTVDAVLKRIDDELDRRQAEAGAPEESRIHSILLTQPDAAQELLGGRLRAFLAVALLGAAATVSTAFLVDGFARGRSRHSSVERQEAA